VEAMAEKFDPEKMQKDLMDNLKKMMSQTEMKPNTETEKAREETEEETVNKRKKILEFNLKPKEVKKYLDRFVIKQEDAKKVLSTAVCDHYNHIRASIKENSSNNYMKQNVIMLGPTGVGKTYLIRHLADLIGVPFTKADATKFSETGYMGGDVEDLVRDLVQKADGDIELAQYGMIYLDEVDKIATPTKTMGRDVSGSGVQRGLLKIMEETEVSLRNPMDIQSQIQGMMEFQKKGKSTNPAINTKHILFIVSGAFADLEEIIQKRLKQTQIGFASQEEKNKHSDQVFQHAETKDFLDFGFEPEFIGRLPVRVICNSLNEEDLFTILTSSEESILKQYVAGFDAYDIKMTPTDNALWEIAKLAAKEKTGARGLFTVFEKVFRNLKYELPSTHLKEFTLTPELVTQGNEEMDKLLSEERKEQKKEISEEIKKFEKQFNDINNISIKFDNSAIEAIQEKIIDEGANTVSFLQKLLANYAYGLGLISQKTTKKKFNLDKNIILNPNAVLDEWIKKAYDKS